MRAYWLCDARTGDKLARVMPSDGAFKRVLCGSGSGHHTFRLGIGKRTRNQWRALTQPWARALLIEEDGQAIYVGLIAKRPYKWKVWSITITHVDYREVFRRRYPFGIKSYWADELLRIPGKLVITGKSWRAVAAIVARECLLGPTNTYSLPIVLPSTTEAGDATVTYENYLFRSGYDIFEDIQNLDGGPDIDFRPRLTSTGFELVMDVGSVPTPHLIKQSADFNMTVPHPVLLDVSYDEDATNQLTGIFSVGAGSEVDMAVGGRGFDEASTIPALDVVETHKAESDIPRLAALSAAALPVLGQPTVQVDFSLVSTAKHNAATMPVGSMARMYFKDDPWIPDGWTEARVIAVAGSTGRKIQFETQPLVGA